METITLNVINQGILPGTSKWLVSEIKRRNCVLKIGKTHQSRHPGVFLEYDDEKGRSSKTLALFYAPYDYGNPKICLFPFEEDYGNHEPVSLFGAALTSGGQAVLAKIMEQAGELLEKALATGDSNPEPVIVVAAQ